MDGCEQSSISLRFEHTEKQRYYHVVAARDLFGDWVITKAWGGINKATGRITHFPCLSHAEAAEHIHKITKIREKRGYVLCAQNTCKL